MQAANSSRLRHQLFSGQVLILDTVPSLKETIKFPQTSDEYQELARLALSSQQEELQDGEGIPSKSQSMKLASKEIAVYPESALLLHLIKQSQCNPSF